MQTGRHSATFACPPTATIGLQALIAGARPDPLLATLADLAGSFARSIPPDPFSLDAVTYSGISSTRARLQAARRDYRVRLNRAHAAIVYVGSSEQSDTTALTAALELPRRRIPNPLADLPVAIVCVSEGSDLPVIHARQQLLDAGTELVAAVRFQPSLIADDPAQDEIVTSALADIVIALESAAAVNYEWDTSVFREPRHLAS
ncbi:hypothetical protein HJ588_13155 [Flexivirga sp. ID2601S]|uniref:Uncharacterized protein n=1 Tax=Flexivirga aerilata TaxID=1656889 RepID=A0A849AH93_9MICO|nr:hypothetical protein [Flexivirga aerilata]NNG40214.1 hypothetical protein [Flexivirga aerilata]